MTSPYHRHRFPPDIIGHAIWLYHRFTLSFRDVEDLLAKRGITVSYEAIQFKYLFSGVDGTIVRRGLRNLCIRG